MNALARAWAEAQTGLDPATARILRALASSECSLSGRQLAFLADVDEDAVAEHVAALANAGLLLVQGERLELNFDEEMLIRHLRRNRRQIGSGAPPVPVDPKPVPQPQPKTAKPPAPPARVFVRQGSPEWNAWLRVRGPRGIPVSYSQTDRAHGWWFASLWPEQRETCPHTRVDK